MNESEKRTSVVYVRVKKLDKERLAELANSYGLSQSDYLLATGLGRDLKPVIPRIVPELNKEKWNELSATTANLNQLTYHLNSGKIIESSKLKSLLEELKEEVVSLRVNLLGES